MGVIPVSEYTELNPRVKPFTTYNIWQIIKLKFSFASLVESGCCC